MDLAPPPAFQAGSSLILSGLDLSPDRVHEISDLPDGVSQLIRSAAEQPAPVENLVIFVDIYLSDTRGADRVRNHHTILRQLKNDSSPVTDEATPTRITFSTKVLS